MKMVNELHPQQALLRVHAGSVWVIEAPRGRPFGGGAVIATADWHSPNPWKYCGNPLKIHRNPLKSVGIRGNLWKYVETCGSPSKSVKNLNIRYSRKIRLFSRTGTSFFLQVNREMTVEIIHRPVQYICYLVHYCLITRTGRS